MGGFLAAEFALKNPKKTVELILLSIRQKYAAAQLKEIESKLRTGKNAYLYKFYLACFSEHDKEGLAWFKKNIFKSYLKEMELDSLIEGLRYLSEAEINLEPLSVLKKVRIFHGAQDKIVPFPPDLLRKSKRGDKKICPEAALLKSYLPLSKFSWAEFICMQETGHIPFLNHNFNKSFCNG